MGQLRAFLGCNTEPYLHLDAFYMQACNLHHVMAAPACRSSSLSHVTSCAPTTSARCRAMEAMATAMTHSCQGRLPPHQHPRPLRMAVLMLRSCLVLGHGHPKATTVAVMPRLFQAQPASLRVVSRDYAACQALHLKLEMPARCPVLCVPRVRCRTRAVCVQHALGARSQMLPAPAATRNILRSTAQSCE